MHLDMQDICGRAPA